MSNSGDAMLPALRGGLGIARLPGFIVDADLAAGTLEAILTDWRPPPIALHLMTPPSPLRPARVEALIDFLATRFRDLGVRGARSEEHTSELQSLMRISYAVFCLKKKN